MDIRNFKIKAKKKKILYQAYLEKQKQNNINEKKSADQKIDNEKKERKQRKEKITDHKTTLTIAIASLDNKCGCSYITQALASYIKDDINSSVCVIDFKRKDTEKNNSIFFYGNVDICNLYDNYKYIIIDIGNINNCSEDEINEFKRSNIKIMISKPDDTYFRRIAAKIKEDKEAVKKWAFMFNLVDEDLVGLVEERMIGYEFYNIPLINKDRLKDNVKRIFFKIIKNKR